MSNARDPTASAETRSSQALRARWSVPIGNLIHETREAWPGLSTYKKFEQLVSLALTVVIAIVIVVALFELCYRVVLLLLEGLIDPAEQEIFSGLVRHDPDGSHCS